MPWEEVDSVKIGEMEGELIGRDGSVIKRFSNHDDGIFIQEKEQ